MLRQPIFTAFGFSAFWPTAMSADALLRKILSRKISSCNLAIPRTCARPGSKLLSVILGIGIIGILTPAPASAAEIVKAMTAEDISALMENAGFQTKILPDRDTGAPVGLGRAGPYNFVIRALECESVPLSCKRLLFFANFDLNRRPVTADYKAANRFNESHPDGRAFIIENSAQMGVDYIIDLTGGVTPDHVASRLRRWKGVIEDLAKDITARGPGV